MSKYFDIPIIVISTLSASFSVGSQNYLKQSMISTITCGISMSIAILSSIKLYLNLDDLIKKEVDLSKSFYLLSLEIYKTLHINKDLRKQDGLEFLNKKYNDYTKLISQSELLRKRLKHDELEEIDNRKFYFSDSDKNSNSSILDNKISFSLSRLFTFVFKSDTIKSNSFNPLIA